MSWLDLAVGAGIAATAYSSGASIGFTRGKKAERRKVGEPPQLICTCTHGYGSHEDGKHCHGEVQRANKWDKDFGTERGWEYVPCPCKLYDGPEPLATMLNWQPPAPKELPS